jgi:hypothetical protein
MPAAPTPLHPLLRASSPRCAAPGECRAALGALHPCHYRHQPEAEGGSGAPPRGNTGRAPPFTFVQQAPEYREQAGEAQDATRRSRHRFNAELKMSPRTPLSTRRVKPHPDIDPTTYSPPYHTASWPQGSTALLPSRNADTADTTTCCLSHVATPPTS